MLLQRNFEKHCYFNAGSASLGWGVDPAPLLGGLHAKLVILFLSQTMCVCVN